jgi:hypothetical protein
VEVIFQKTFRETLALMGLTDEFLQKFQGHYCSQESLRQGLSYQPLQGGSCELL